jgi:hypothetical protein
MALIPVQVTTHPSPVPWRKTFVKTSRRCVRTDDSSVEVDEPVVQARVPRDRLRRRMACIRWRCAAFPGDRNLERYKATDQVGTGTVRSIVETPEGALGATAKAVGMPPRRRWDGAAMQRVEAMLLCGGWDTHPCQRQRRSDPRVAREERRAGRLRAQTAIERRDAHHDRGAPHSTAKTRGGAHDDEGEHTPCRPCHVDRES